jgi:LEA14-like dessication related protein
MARMKRPLLLASLAALVAMSSGCAYLRKLASKAFQQPSLTFKTAQLADASLGSATVNLIFDLENPNPVGLSIAEVGYAFFVEGKQVTAGSPQRGLRIPASGRTELVFPANIKFADVAPVIQTFLNKDVASYRAEGFLGVKTPIGVLRVPLAREGTFEVPKVPTIQIAEPKVRNLSFTGATLEIPLTIKSRNSFPIPIAGLTGALEVSGAKVGSLSTGDLGQLPGGETRQVNIPVTVHFAQAATAAAALTRGSGTLGFSGQLSSGPASVPFNFNQTVKFHK